MWRPILFSIGVQRAGEIVINNENYDAGHDFLSVYYKFIVSARPLGKP